MFASFTSDPIQRLPREERQNLKEVIAMAGLVTAHGNQQYRRSLARVNDQTDIELARSASIAEVDSGRLDGLQLIATRAMQGVALVSQLEQQLAQIVPIAASRLQAVGDVHALASAQAVSDAVRRLR